VAKQRLLKHIIHAKYRKFYDVLREKHISTLSLAARRCLSSSISSCNSLNKPRSSFVIARYNLRRFTDHCEDADDVTADDPHRADEDDPDPDRGLENDPLSRIGVFDSLTILC